MVVISLFKLVTMLTR